MIFSMESGKNNKRGNIVKGKFVKLKIALSLMLVLALGAVFALSLMPKGKEINSEVFALHQKVELGQEGMKDEYSALFGGDVIFSAEKVLVNNELNAYGYPDKIDVGAKIFNAGQLKDLKDTEEPIDMISDYKYHFTDIASETGYKTVVEDGQFVMLKNVSNGTVFYNKDHPNRQEAIMISFGVYVYDRENNVVNVAKNETKEDNTVIPAIPASPAVYAGITYLEVAAYHNDKQIETPAIRNINIANKGLFFDFAHLLTQKEDDSNEGQYSYVLRYMINGIEYTNNFSFFVVNESSYTRTVGKQEMGYSAMPTLGWTDGSINYAKTTPVEGYVRYLIGKDGINKSSSGNGNNDVQGYPTITYDYTKYKLSYVHNANQKNTIYDFAVEYSATASGVNPDSLVCTITSNEGTRQQRIKLRDYDPKSPINLVTIMLTDPGTYVARSSYLYQGYNSQIAPEMNFKINDIKLSVHGMDAYYSKANVEGAKMQYFTLSTTIGNHVDLFIPNGYDWNETAFAQNKKLGFAYVVKETVAGQEEKVREGNIYLQESQNALINSDLKLDTTNVFGVVGNEYKNAYDSLLAYSTVTMSENIATESVTVDNALATQNLLNNIKYAQTNQGSLWIDGNDTYEQNTALELKNSFYYYSSSRLTLDSFYEIEGTKDGERYSEITKILSAKEGVKFNFTNTTTFNKKGFYLVFIKVVPNGIVESSYKDEYTYFQVFAFEYTSSSVNIKLEKIIDDTTSEEITGGNFTNKDVRVSWATPGLFDRKINAYYHASLNNALSKEELLKTTKNVLSSNFTVNGEGKEITVAELGSDNVDVKDGTFVKFMIRLECEGDTATYKTFTIDRTPIRGVQPYLIQEGYMGTAVSYAFATDRFNNYVALTSGITDGYATLDWTDKASQAKITATYSYTPFRATSNAVEEIVAVNGLRWITTNYELGTTIVGAELKKSSSKFNVSTDCIMFNQGIYLIHLQDEAGNSCEYAFVIDRTPNYFKVDGTFISNGMYLSANNVDYSVGSYKSFKLDVKTDSQLAGFLEAASQNKVHEMAGYYNGSTTNAYSIANHFQKSADNSIYLTVKNTEIQAFTTSDVPDKSISSISGTMDYRNIQPGESCYKRILYVVSANHTDITKSSKAHSSVTIEINKDNALGKAYYSSDFIDESDIPVNSGENSATATAMDLGSDANSETAIGLTKAGATSARHLAFIWNKGTGIYEVNKVEYKLYNLNSSFDKNYFFYQKNSSDPTIIYKAGEVNSTVDLQDGRLLYNFNGSNQALEGLYIVTRYYRDAESTDAPDYGEDLGIRNYYFIVDRNGIIDVSQEIGEHIKLLLKENETEFNNFSSTGSGIGEIFQFKEDNTLLTGRYNVYLTTTKLPAVLQVPTGKYFDGEFSSVGYNAGRLRVSVYFRDVYQQFPENDSTRTQIKLIYQGDYAKEEVYKNKCFDMDIFSYLRDNYGESSNLFSRLTISDGGKNWLYLPGHYIIRITDRVFNELGTTNEKFIGLNINGEDNSGPQANVYTGSSKANMVTAVKETLEEGSTNRSIMASQEFLKITLPHYVEAETRTAQIDPNYIVIEQYIDSVRTQTQQYFNLKSVVDENVVLNPDGTIDVYLNTMLRDRRGDIDLANLNRDLKYVIKIRYDLNNNTDGKYTERFRDCYVYYTEDGKRKTYYESAYTITIDREAPKNNVENLNKNDALVNEYNSEFGTKTMFTNGVHESTQLHFTYQYDKYYQTNNGSYLYAYHVRANTPFDKTDLSEVYVKEFDFKTNSLNLPFFAYSYIKKDVSKLPNTGAEYQGLILEAGKYYEIVEVDKAGNTTQYLICYEPSNAEWTMPIQLVAPDENPAEEITEQTKEISFFEIQANGNSEFKNDLFFKIVLRRNNKVVKTWLTNVNTEFSGLGGEIVKAINDEANSTTGSGGFDLEIVTRTTRSDVDINMFNSDKIIDLDIKKLVVGTAKNYVIDLDGANVYDSEQDLMFYAESITVKGKVKVDGKFVYGTYKYVAERNGRTIKYYLESGNGKEVGVVETDGESTYVLYLEPVIGKVPDPYRFNAGGKLLEEVTFDGDRGYTQGSNKHYGFSTAKLTFDNTVYEAYVEKKNKISGLYEQDASLTPVPVGIYSTITFTELADELQEYKVMLKISGEDPSIHYIIIDKRTSVVVLKDSKGATQDDAITVEYNANVQDNFNPENIPNGVMLLNWSEFSTDYFDYKYILHEKVYNSQEELVFISRDLTGQQVEEIITKEPNPGIYRFEIVVYSKNDAAIRLGNCVFAFEVKSNNADPYEVRDESGANISYLKKQDSERITITIKELKASLLSYGNAFDGLLDTAKVDLYISTQTLEVIPIGQNQKVALLNEVDVEGHTFSFYKVFRGETYSLYFGILKIQKNENLVSGVQLIAGDLYDVGHETSFITAFEKDSKSDVSLKGTVSETKNVLLAKNKMQMEIQYLGKTVKNINIGNPSILRNGIVLEGSGKFTIIFKDIAGNVHKYSNGQVGIDITVLREVMVTLNDEAPVTNAIYNAPVKMSIFASAIYKAGSVKVVAYRNGEEYDYSGQNPNYIFSDFGNYRIEISATYRQGLQDIALNKIIYFSILNVKEARTSIDLTSLSGYRLEKVTNAKGIDITNDFISMMNANGMHVSYQNVMDNASKLQVTSGKVTFNLEYFVEDGVYPPRKVVFSFTLNSETPKIHCTLKTGESTTKKFEIYFNPSIIFEQIGEAGVYVNGELVARINENSSNEEVRIAATYKENGDGDYYITLVSSSGVVLDSYKVTIKEPLNAWAIIVIIAVVGVVATVVVTIIVLRRKMRIR